MASLNFCIYDGGNFSLNLAGSGLGFYGSTFGRSVEVGSYQTTTYVTDSNGLTQGQACNNITYTHANSGKVGAATESIGLQYIPNYQATVNIRFEHTSEVNVQNANLYVYDRVSIANAPSGVTCKAAEVIHPSVSQAVLGSGDAAWYTFTTGSTTPMPLAESPGMSGLYAGSGAGSTRTDTRHDWYVAMSCSPNSVSSKHFAVYFSTEYL